MSTTEDGREEEEQGFLESPYQAEGYKKLAEAHSTPRSGRRPLIFYLRLLLELAMAGAIAALLARPISSLAKPSPVPQCTGPLSRNYVTGYLSGCPLT